MPFLDQGERSPPLPPSHPSVSSYVPVNYSTTGSDITMDPRPLEYAPAPDGFQNSPRNSIPPAELRYDYQTQGTPAAMHSPPFNQVPGTYYDHGHAHSSESSLVNSDVVPPPHPTTHPTNQDTPTLSATVGPIDPQPSRHQCTLCVASYTRLSGLNRHHKDVHLPWISCDHCGLEFSSGRRYLFTRHLETDHPNA